jgi:hypothetical protein
METYDDLVNTINLNSVSFDPVKEPLMRANEPL